MTGSADWSAREAIESSAPIAYRGMVYRAHSDLYEPLDPTGSLYVSGRWNLGYDRYVADRAFAALYTGLGPETPLAETLRHAGAGRMRHLRHYVLSRIRVELSAVYDLGDWKSLGLVSREAILGRSLVHTHALAEIAYHAGAEGLLVPSSTLAGDALVIFTANLRSDSVMEVIGTNPLRLRP